MAKADEHERACGAPQTETLACPHTGTVPREEYCVPSCRVWRTGDASLDSVNQDGRSQYGRSVACPTQ